jgi:hypothetical protein
MLPVVLNGPTRLLALACDDVRAEYVSAWQHAENRLAAASAVLHELPQTSQPALFQLLHNLKSLQNRRYQQVHQLTLPSAATIKFIEEATEEQLLLAQQVADFISYARVDHARRQSAMIASAEARRVHEQALAALLRETARATPRRRAERDEDEEDDDHYDRRKRRSKASDRRRGQDDSGSFLSGSVKAIGGTGIMLAVAVVFNGIQFAERIFGLNIPSSQFIAHEQQDVDSRGSATSDNARPMVAVQGDKPFVDRLATGLPAVAPDSSRPPAQATTPTTPIDDGVPGRAAPLADTTPTERAAAPPKVKVATKVANPDVAEARSPAKPKAVMTAAVRPPPPIPCVRRLLRHPASMKAMGSTLPCCRRTRRPARRRKSSPSCRRSMLEFSDRNSPKSRSSAVKPARGTASWQLLPRRRRRPTRSATTCVRPAMAAAGSKRTEAMSASVVRLESK